MDNRTAFFAVVIMAVVTALLRFLPFLIFGGKHKTPKAVTYLGKVLPCAVMGMLVIYCLRDVTFGSLAGFLPSLIACAVVVGLYLLKKNTLLSIAGGTVCYMILVQFVF